MSTYPTGTVAIATVRAQEGVRVMRSDLGSPEWVSATSVDGVRWHSTGDLTEIRTLVVLDLDAANPHGEPTIKLSNLLEQLRKGTDVCRGVADQIAEQTAPPKPPRIPEPTEPSVRVKAGPNEWAKIGPWWVCADLGEMPREWDYLVDLGIES